MKSSGGRRGKYQFGIDHIPHRWVCVLSTRVVFYPNMISVFRSKFKVCFHFSLRTSRALARLGPISSPTLVLQKIREIRLFYPHIPIEHQGALWWLGKKILIRQPLGPSRCSSIGRCTHGRNNHTRSHPYRL